MHDHDGGTEGGPCITRHLLALGTGAIRLIHFKTASPGWAMKHLYTQLGRQTLDSTIMSKKLYCISPEMSFQTYTIIHQSNVFYVQCLEVVAVELGPPCQFPISLGRPGHPENSTEDQPPQA